MSFFDSLEHVRSRPEHERFGLTIIVSSLFTLAVVGGWMAIGQPFSGISTIAKNVPSSQQFAAPVQSVSSQFEEMKKTISNQYNSTYGNQSDPLQASSNGLNGLSYPTTGSTSEEPLPIINLPATDYPNQ